MSRRKSGQDIHGVVLLDKPAGLSSNRALQMVRGKFNARKAGHTGSLDPFATGMLPVCLGEASKTAAYLLDASKTYRATARFGAATDTGDIEGEIVETAPVPACETNAIDLAMNAFRGDIEQVPPMYSALKHAGTPLYKLARQGIEVERPSRQITIYRLEIVGWNSPLLEFEVHCSKGTYIRTLAADLAEAMGSRAHLVALRRLSVEPFGDGPMVTLEDLDAALDNHRLCDHLQAVDAGLQSWPVISLDKQQCARFRHGNPFPVSVSDIPFVRVYSADQRILGLACVTPEGELRPVRVFNIDSASGDAAQNEPTAAK
jgi:tRNA pseudouridine55 synthase